MEIGITDATNDMDSKKFYQLVERLFPICRSITGDGVRETLKILSEIIPLQITEVPSGTKVFDWEVPEEWNIRSGWIKNSKGDKILDFDELNLHVLNYSTPISEEIGLDKLKEHLFTLPDQPDLVPYRTSYHSRRWGFCMSHNQMLSLEDDRYHVNIDSSIETGSLTYGEIYLKGELQEEFLISCHICHPSLCNDNLSGIAIAIYLADYLSKQHTKYSYRFLFIPGTIGSITWLSKNEDKVHQIKNGLVLNLLGDGSDFHYKKSRQANAEIDEIMAFVLKKDVNNNEILEFSPYGYDERQFCSPGFNLPVGRLSRKPHGEFPEYHTSADNLRFVKNEYLVESFDLLLKAISIVELNGKFINQNPKCEPALGKRGLYQSIGGQKEQQEFQMSLLWVLNYSDGANSLLDIAKKSELDFDMIQKAADELVKCDLLKKIDWID